MLTITLSNRLEVLQETLLARLAESVAEPFEREQIIIPSMALRRHLQLALADRFGVCTQINFSFLATWMWGELGKDASPLFKTPENALWRIYHVLGDKQFLEAHPRLAQSLVDADALLYFERAQQIAGYFDQIIAYRPDWLSIWAQESVVSWPEITMQQQADERWQAALWLRLRAGYVGWEQSWFSPPSVGARALHVFCLPAIAPLYLEALHTIARTRNVYVYALNPSRAYWFDVVDARRLAYLELRGEIGHHSIGNTLLAAWGKQTQAQLHLLLAEGEIEDGFLTNAELGKEQSILLQIQDAILELHDFEGTKLDLNGWDRSLEIHVCHSLTREIEVLQDQLLSHFARDTSLKLSDVLVVFPDLETAAPIIDAIWGTADETRRLPYTITGRSAEQENPFVEALLHALALPDSRFEASHVFAFVQQPCVARRFDLGEDDLQQWHEWMDTAHLRWGLDAADRVDVNVIDQHSFSKGIERLMLAYALPGENHFPFSGILAAGEVEGSRAPLLGTLWQFQERLLALRSALKSEKTAGEWGSTLFLLLEEFTCASVHDQSYLIALQSQIRTCCAAMEEADAQAVFPLAVLRAALMDSFEQQAHGGVPGGSITFSSIASLRNLPFRIICVLGMNDGAYPSAARMMEFDLIAAFSRLGDRQRRLDERNIFLDLLLSARDYFYLSYSGRSIHDNAVMPPSVLLADLLDFLCRVITHIDGVLVTPELVRAQCLLEHPLQAYSRSAFDVEGDWRLRSNDVQYCAALQEAAANPTRLSMPFFSTQLALRPDEMRCINLLDLVRFFRNPAKALLRDRLRLRFITAQEELRDEEDFEPEYLAQQTLAARLLPLIFAKVDEDQIMRSASAGLEYPADALGVRRLHTDLRKIKFYAARISDACQDEPKASISGVLSFEIAGQHCEINGSCSEIYGHTRVSHEFREFDVHVYLGIWIEHLFMNAMQNKGTRFSSRIIGASVDREFEPVDDAYARLEELLGFYVQGMTQPLHFFPRASWVYVDKKGNLEKARENWDKGESMRSSYALAFRGIGELLNSEFEILSQKILGPLYQQISKEG